MGIREIIEGKRQWRAYMARVKVLPADYQIVYGEIQKYFFKVGPADPELLPGLLEFFEQGVADGTGVIELIGEDVADFADQLIKDTTTYADTLQREIGEQTDHESK